MGDSAPNDRKRLHRLIESIPEHQLAAAAAVLEPLADPVLHAFLTAPADDEPLTEAEIAAIEEGRADVAAGRVVLNDELRRELGW